MLLLLLCAYRPKCSHSRLFLGVLGILPWRQLHDGWGYDDAGWEGFLAPPDAYDVYIDSHIYHAFGPPEEQPTPWQNIQYTCKNDVPKIMGHTNTDWTIVGEWSLASGTTALGV